MPFGPSLRYMRKHPESPWKTLRPIVIAVALLTALHLGGKSATTGMEATHQRELAAKSFAIHKSQVGNQIKRCEALRESSNSYHAGNWRIEVSDKGVDVTCIQEGYRVPR